MDPNSRAVCIFRSLRTDHSEHDYEQWAKRMDDLVVTMPGYVSHTSFRDDASGKGVTISYFDSMEHLVAWKEEPLHREAQALGRTEFYSEYEIEVAEIVRNYRWRLPEQ